MILNKNINPERDLYFLGGKVIEVLGATSQSEFDYFELYAALNKTSHTSINLFSLVLDWLFILGAIKKGEKGFIKKCF